MSTNPHYEAVIGLEIHAQLKTESKIFCSDPTTFDASDNENTSPVSVGMPGTLPVLNRKAVDFAIRAGLALNCTIAKKSVFARKNYFYPDLPKGYQISQYDKPICENGQVVIKVGGQSKIIKIQRAHLEEDAGKSIHHGDYTLLNYNRAGIPLLEIVSGPDMSTPSEAAEYARQVRQILRYVDVCDGNLEEGSLRCDCNISVRLRGEKKLGVKVEIKNINSFRFVEKALEYEIDRQIDAIEAGELIVQETRLWDPDKNRTFTMRLKEDAHDYRYFPDPDLLPVTLTNEEIEQVRSNLPELPTERAGRFVSHMGLPEYDAHVITQEREIADYFELVAKTCGNPKASSNWIMSELLRELNDSQIPIDKSPVSPEMLGDLIKLIDQGTISGKIGKVVFSEMWQTSKAAEVIIKEKGLVQISDEGMVERSVDEIMQANPQQVADYRSGKTKLFGFFVGQVMKATQGQANPDVVNKILIRKLNL